MKTLHTLLVALCLMATIDVSAQNAAYDIRFALESVDCETRTVCIFTQVRAAEGEAWNLAGQNYRIFYDGSKADYISGTGESMLDPAQYSTFPAQERIQDTPPLDASMFGDQLPFMETLAFLNYSIDLMDLSNGGMILPATGEWVTTTKLCFEVSQEVIDEPSNCLSLVWARIGLTDQIATASVEISEWVENGVTLQAETVIYDDLGPEDGNDACISSFCPGGADAETSLIACMDGIDNDEDGLIDCADPNCSIFTECGPDAKTFDLVLQLAPNGVDCVTGVTCYDVNLTSAGSAFNLGSQNYRIFYNSDAGTFLSAQSLLGADFQAVSLQNGTPREGIDATGVGPLPYESTLGFVDFTVQLNDSGTGSAIEINADEPTQVAQVCFTIEPAVIREGSLCFEANWAEFGLTDPYETAFVEIEEWLGPNNTRITSVNDFGNLSSVSGDDACFNISCSECDADAPVISGVTDASNTSCDFVTGAVSLSSTGGNTTDAYITEYALLSVSGTIRDLQDQPDFQIADEGMYTVVAINYRSDQTPADLVIGNRLSMLVSDCIEISEGYTFTVCEETDQCTECLGVTVSLDEFVGNTGTTTEYVLTDTRGEILIISGTPGFNELGIGLYSGVSVTYETASGITGLEVGQSIADITCICTNISPAEIFGVCDQLMPEIMLDLNSCDIANNAILFVDDVYDQYTWSTGAQEPETSIPANRPAIYSVTVTLANGCQGVAEIEITGNELSQIGDFVFEDLNVDGRQDPSDQGINGITVNLYTDDDMDGIPDSDTPSCTTTTVNNPNTGAAGYYEFFVYEGNYVLEFLGQDGFTPTSTNVGDDNGDSDISLDGLTSSIPVGEGEIIDNIDAGFGISSILEGSVWEDLDADGRRDDGEPGINGVTVNIFRPDGVLVETVVTTTIDGEDGVYIFDEIPEQGYYVEIELPEGSVLSDPNVSSDESLDSDGTGANGPNTTDIINTSATSVTEDVDFGTYFGGNVCGIVWRDAPMGVEGIFESGVDSAINNSTVYIIDEETRDTVMTAITDANGDYCLESVPVGSYRVRFGATPLADAYVPINTGSDPLFDSDVNTTSAQTEVFFVGSRDTILGVNAGLRMGVVPVTISSFSGYWDRRKNVNVIEWTTAVEINNERFDIERLIGFDDSFEVIGSIDGQGNSSESNGYHFVDTDTEVGGNYYYRLKQIDYNGGEDYSDIIVINIIRLKSAFSNDNGAGDFLKVFPNPASDEVQVLLASETNTTIDINLTDLTGRVISSWNNVSIDKGPNAISLDLEHVSTGSYLLQFFDGDRLGHQLLQVVK